MRQFFVHFLDLPSNFLIQGMKFFISKALAITHKLYISFTNFLIPTNLPIEEQRRQHNKVAWQVGLNIAPLTSYGLHMLTHHPCLYVAIYDPNQTKSLYLFQILIELVLLQVSFFVIGDSYLKANLAIFFVSTTYHMFNGSHNWMQKILYMF